MKPWILLPLGIVSLLARADTVLETPDCAQWDRPRWLAYLKEQASDYTLLEEERLSSVLNALDQCGRKLEAMGLQA